MKTNVFDQIQDSAKVKKHKSPAYEVANLVVIEEWDKMAKSKFRVP
jgi:hypothetical protein